MKEFDYELDYKSLDFTDTETRKLYRIGRGEQGVLLVRPYTDDICAHWRFRTPDIAVKSSNKIFAMYLDYRDKKTSLVWTCVASFWRWVSPGRDVMLTTTVAESIRKARKLCCHKRTTMPPVSMQNQHRSSRRFVTS